MQTRRGFLEAAAACCAGAALAATPLESLLAKEARQKLAAQDLGGGLSLITGAGANVLAFGSPEGALLFDGGAREHSKALLKLAPMAVGAKRVTTLVNTHWHPEQTGSNEALGKQGARLIAQENTKLWLGRKYITVDWSPTPFLALPKSALPNKTFYGTDKLEFGGETIALGHLGQAHTDGDLYAYLPKANVLVAGGVVSNAGWPLMDWQTGGWIGGLVGACDRLLKIANDSTRVIPANGPVIGRKELQAQRDMYFQIFDRLVKQLIKGMGPDEAYASGPAKEYETQWGDSKPFVLASFRSLWGHYAPDA
jgi:glyoxylase-like metal-dependent hydrolase (beta-lactamase superfamily II)